MSIFIYLSLNIIENNLTGSEWRQVLGACLLGFILSLAGFLFIYTYERSKRDKNDREAGKRIFMSMMRYIIRVFAIYMTGGLLIAFLMVLVNGAVDIFFLITIPVMSMLVAIGMSQVRDDRER